MDHVLKFDLIQHTESSFFFFVFVFVFFVFFFVVSAGSLSTACHSVSYRLIIWISHVWVLLISLLPGAHKSNHE